MYFERLDRKVTLEQSVTTINQTSGEPVPTWVTVYSLWAQKKALQGSENFKAEAEVSKANALWYIRYIHNLDAQSYRLRDENGVIWDIVGEHREIGRREGLELSCSRRAE